MKTSFNQAGTKVGQAIGDRLARRVDPKGKRTEPEEPNDPGDEEESG